MIVFVKSTFAMITFFLIYYFIRNFNIKYIKFYIISVQIILIIEMILCISNQELDIMYLCVLLFYELLYISFIKDVYRKDCHVETLYKEISKSNMKPIYLCGLSELKIENIDNYCNELNIFFNQVIPNKTLNYGFVMAENDEIQISIILFRINLDYEMLINKISYPESLELENIKGGCQIKYSMKM